MSPRWVWSFGLFPILLVTVALAAPGTPSPFDWPQWQGPQRTAISQETGLLKQWPREGPPLAWKVNHLGGGYSTPSVAAGRIFGMSYRGKDEVVWALNEADGKELWVTKIAAAGKAGYNEGSRCSPTVDGQLLYVLGISGDLACLETATGTIRWQKNVKEIGGQMMSGWGYSESPLVDGNQVVCSPGGSRGSIAAFDKLTGKQLWQTKELKDAATYSSIIVAEVDGVRQYIQTTFAGQRKDGEGYIVGVAAKDGKLLWRVPREGYRTAVIPTPTYHDNHVFVTAGYGAGCDLIKLTFADGSFKADKIYTNKNMVNHHGGVVRIGEYIYGYSEGKGWICLEFKTGKTVWDTKSLGKGSIAYADGHLYCRAENGTIALVEANPEKFVEKGRFNQPDRTRYNAWPHPVIANGKLYIRDQDLLLCYDVKQKLARLEPELPALLR